MNKHIIFGTGPMGIHVMQNLAARGEMVQMINRSGKAPTTLPAGVSVIAADVANLESAHNAASGATHIYNCVNAPYDKWDTLMQPLFANILAVAAKANAKLIVGDNLYMYGDTNGAVIREDLPEQANTKKGKIRAQISAQMLAAHRAGTARVGIVRGADFIGPFVTNAVMGERAIAPATQGKAAQLVGNPDLPHTNTFIGDMAKAMVLVGERDDALGQVWFAPNDTALTQRQIINMVFTEAGHKPRYTIATKLILQGLGIFMPPVREVVEMLYQFEKPFVVDSSKFERTFGVKGTPMDEVVRQTVAWYKHNAAGQK